MSGQKVILDFIQEMSLEAGRELQNVRKILSEMSDSEDVINDLLQAEADIAVIESIKELFDRGQLTEKRLQDRLKQLREVSND